MVTFFRSINFTLICAILMLVLAQNAFIFYNTLQQANTRIEQDSSNSLKFHLEHLAENVRYLLRTQDYLRVQEEVTGLSADPSIKLAMLLDEKDVVLASLRRADIGGTFVSNLKTYTALEQEHPLLQHSLAEARAKLVYQIQFNADNSGVYGLYPISMGRTGHSLRPDRQGVLLVWQDLSALKAGVRGDLLTQSYDAVLAVIFGALLILSMFSYWVVRPINHLNVAAQHLASRNWEYVKQLPLHRNDEVGHLAKAFARMSRQLKDLFNDLEAKVQKRTQQLEVANAEICSLNERLQAENVRMSTELEVTRRLQQMVLPHEKELQQIDDLDIACFMEPASEVGGDYYDVLQHNGHIKIGIGDVTGHGLESGVLMLMVQTAVRTLLLNNVNDPRVFMSTLNRAIYDNVQRMKSDKNLTLSILDYNNGRLSLSGQHEEVLYVHRYGDIRRIDTIDLGFMVGLTEDISEFVSNVEVELQLGEGIVLYTDGITEARNAAGELYGIDRLCHVIQTHWQCSAQAVQQAVINDVRQHVGDQTLQDDLTLLVIKQKTCREMMVSTAPQVKLEDMVV